MVSKFKGYTPEEVIFELSYKNTLILKGGQEVGRENCSRKENNGNKVKSKVACFLTERI